MKRRVQGQGVVEYAGALVLAAAMVSLALAVLPGDFMSYFGMIIDTAADFMITQLQGSLV